MTSLILIDNYDSFTWNLYHLIGALEPNVEVYRNDQIDVKHILEKAPSGIVLSPGPCTPLQAGICLDLIQEVGGIIPILGVCLGHQSIAHVYGGVVTCADVPVHGKIGEIFHKGQNIFEGLPTPFYATRYHSLIVDRATLPTMLHITAETQEGVIMGLAHRTDPTYGVQFHPESILTEHGSRMMRNFLDITHKWERP